MKFIIGNIETKVITGGSDNLVGDLKAQLDEYLKIRPEGYFRVPAFKKRHWDGWRKFITKDGRFATGFLPMVAAYVEELGYEVEIMDTRNRLPKMMPIEPYIGMIDGEEWEARDYQADMAENVNATIVVGGQEIYFPRGILDCATNAGKNTMAAILYNSLIGNVSGVFLVSSTLIYKQAVSFFSQALGEPVGQVCSKSVTIGKFTVCMAKTLLNRAKESMNIRKWLSETEFLVVDESDEAGASDYSEVLTYVGAGMRVFLSGTPLESSKVNNMIAVGLSGKVLGKITNKFLIDGGYSQKPNVNILLNNPGKKYFLSYQEELAEFIHLSEQRADQVCEIIKLHEGKSVLISFIEMKHGYFMFDRITEKLPTLPVSIVHGTSPDREQQIENFKNGTTKVLLSSMIIKKGANIPAINVLIAAQGGMSVITVKQITGRALRHDGQSDEVWVYDFYDTPKYLAKHSKKRIRIYENEEFEIIYHYENKKGVPIL